MDTAQARNQETPGFSTRAVIVAVLLSLFLLASSSYIAMRLGALPWPIVFSVIVSGAIIKLLSGRKPINIHEVNVAQAGASVGGLVAAGIVFTVPGIIYLNTTRGLSIEWPNPWLLALLSAVAGLLGVLLSMPLKRTFIDQENLPYPAGTAGAELLKLGGVGGRLLFGVTLLGCAAAVFALLRDLYFPAGLSFAALAAAGFFVSLNPLPLAVAGGYILGARAGYSWLLGALIGWLVLVPLFIGQGTPVPDAQEIVQNLGMGLVLGSGIGFFVSYVAPRLKRIFMPFFSRDEQYRWLFPLLSLLAIFALLLAGVPLLATVLCVVFVWIMVAVAGRMTGETNINPLEQFGIFVGLVVTLTYALLALEISSYALFIIVTFVSVACAVAGDVGHDYKSAVLVQTRFRDIVKVDLIAVLVAGAVAPLVLELIRTGFAGELFTPAMPAPQARLVAGSIFGFAYPAMFWSGFALAFLGELANAAMPGRLRIKVMLMPFGIGLFLGLGLAIPLALGAFIRQIVDRRSPQSYQFGILLAAGVMGGEGIAGFSAAGLVTAGLTRAGSTHILLGVFVLLALLAGFALWRTPNAPD